MRQMPMTTEMTTLHRTSPLAWHCTLSTLTSTSTGSAHHERAESCSLCTFHHTHIWLKFEPCPHSTHDHHHGHPCGCCLFDLTSFFPLRLPPVCLPPQRRAAAGAHQEDHGKPVRLRYQREWGHLRRPLPPHSFRWTTVAILRSSRNMASASCRLVSLNRKNWWASKWIG